VRVDHPDRKRVAGRKERDHAVLFGSVLRDQLHNRTVQAIIIEIDIGDPKHRGLDIAKVLFGHETAFDQHRLERLADARGFFFCLVGLFGTDQPLLL